jgi:RNase H-fold protein (predicted Holliday junction resolvase)
MTNLVNDFIVDLSILNVKIHKIDERLSSKLFKNNESERVDDLSALAILESYIAQNE